MGRKAAAAVATVTGNLLKVLQGFFLTFMTTLKGIILILQVRPKGLP